MTSSNEHDASHDPQAELLKALLTREASPTISVDQGAPLAQVTIELIRLLGDVMAREHATRMNYVSQIQDDLASVKRKCERIETALADYLNSLPKE